MLFDCNAETSFSHLCPSKTDKTYLFNHILVICIVVSVGKSQVLQNKKCHHCDSCCHYHDEVILLCHCGVCVVHIHIRIGGAVVPLLPLL